LRADAHVRSRHLPRMKAAKSGNSPLGPESTAPRWRIGVASVNPCALAGGEEQRAAPCGHWHDRTASRLRHCAASGPRMNGRVGRSTRYGD
jgi:hypothetical protein